MNENIDLTKILKDCPTGTKLYSTIYGNVEFSLITTNNVYTVRFIAENGGINSVTSDGRHIFEFDGECTLFPSREQRDWSKFTAPWYKNGKFNPKTLKPFDRVISRNKYDEWTCTLFSHIGNKPNTRFLYVTCESVYEYCIPYNDEHKHHEGKKDESAEYNRTRDD